MEYNIHIGVDGMHEYIRFRFCKRHPPPPDVGDKVLSAIYIYIYVMLCYFIFAV